MSKINEKIFIELYNAGKDDLELGGLMGISERSAQRLAAQLRKKGKIKYRQELPQSKTLSVPDKLADQIKPVNWVVSKTKIKKQTGKKPFSTYLVIADTHVPYMNVPAVKSILSLMEDLVFDGFVVLGDFMDMSPISHWLKNKKKTLENKRMLKDYIEGNKLLDEFDKRLPKSCDKRFFYGNHENWHEQLIEEYPALEGLLEPNQELKLIERGYKVYDKLNHIEKIGRLAFMHGIYHSQNFVKKHIDDLKTNVIFGHLHTNRERYSPSPARAIAIAGYCIGALCDLSPDFMKNRPNSWVHGFAIVHFFKDGYFDVDLKRIVNGGFIFNEKLYTGC